MKILKRTMAILLVMIISFSVVSVGAEAVSVSTTNRDYGYMLPANYNLSKTVSTVYLNGNYDYINFYINAKSSDIYFFYEIYSDENCTKLVTGDFTYCENSGKYTYTPYIQLLRTFTTGTYYCVTYAAYIDSNENVKISRSSLTTFKIVVNRLPSYNQQMVGLKYVGTLVDGPTVAWYRLNAATVKYHIYRRPLMGTQWVKVGTVNGSKVIFTDKTVKNKSGRYVYTVRGEDKNGNLTRFHYTGVTSHYAAAPVVNSVSASADNKIQVKWNSVGSTAKYYIYRKENNDGWVLLKSNHTGTVFYDTTAQSGNNYRYTVRALIPTSTGNAFSYYYDGKAVDYVAAPEMTAVNKVDDGIKIDWNLVAGATGYTIYRRDFNTRNYWKEIGKTKKFITSFVDETAEQGKSYTYTVRAEGVGVRGSYISAGINYVLLDAPVISSCEQSGNEIFLEWKKIQYATAYEIYTENEAGEWEFLKTVDPYFYEDITASYFVPDRVGELKYRVRGIYKDQSYGEFSDVVSLNYYPHIIGLHSEIRVAGNYFVWNSNSKVDKYNIYRALISDDGETSGEYEFLTTVNGSADQSKIEYIDTSIDGDKSYKYAIKSVYADYEHVDYTEVSFARLPANAVESNETVRFVQTCDSGQRRIYVSGLNPDFEYDIYGYNYKREMWEKLYYGESNGSADIIGYNFPIGNSKGEYTISIVYHKDGKSTPVDANQYTQTFVGGVAGKATAKLQHNGVWFTWEGVAGAKEYLITYRDRKAGIDKTIKVESDGSGVYETLLEVDVYPGVEVSVDIDARVSDLQYVRYNASISSQKVPKLYKAQSESDGCITVYWAEQVETNYRIFRKAENEASWTCINASAHDQRKFIDGKWYNYYKDETVENGVKYTYTVRVPKTVVSSNGNTIYLDSFHDIKGVSAISLSMPTINSATNTTKGVNLGWNKVKGAEGYYVYRKTPSSNWVLIGKVADGATVSYLDTTAKSGTEYYYTIRAYSGSTLSSYIGKYVKYN